VHKYTVSAEGLSGVEGDRKLLRPHPISEVCKLRQRHISGDSRTHGSQKKYHFLGIA